MPAETPDVSFGPPVEARMNAPARMVLLVLASAGHALDAAAPEKADQPGRLDVLQRVAVDEHQVRAPPRFDHAPVGEAEVPGGQGRGGPQRVELGQPGVDEEFQLVVEAVAVA